MINGYYWYRIGTNQWVRGDFLAPGGSGGGSTGGGSFIGYGTVINGDLYCRKQPISGYDEWGLFSNRSEIPIYTCSTPGWYETRWPATGNDVGYVMSQYINMGGSSGSGTGVNTATWAQVLAGNGVYKKESSSSAVCEGVKTLQRYLIAIGWGRAAVLGTSSDLTVDGKFGSKTETAVKNFQYECELTQDGVVGVQTATKLNTYHDDPNFTTQKYHPLSDSEWSYNGLPSWVDEQSVCARLICAEHSRNDSDYSVAHEDARAGIAKVLRNRKNSSAYFNEVDGKEKYSSIIFGSGQFSPATGSSSSRKMARFARRGTSNSVPWQQAILYASKLVNNQTITRASNVTNHLYFNGYTSSWTTSGKKDLVYYPPASTNRFTAFFNR